MTFFQGQSVIFEKRSQKYLFCNSFYTEKITTNSYFFKCNFKMLNEFLLIEYDNFLKN